MCVLNDTESEPLWRWRRVAGTAYADAQADPLGYGPNPLVSSALSMDGESGRGLESPKSAITQGTGALRTLRQGDTTLYYGHRLE